MKRKLIMLVLAFCFISQSSFAQTSSTSNNSVRRGVATVMFAGLAGAVLGLSTLSFYGEPQEHIGNIWTGLALGALGGAGYILSKSTNSANSDVMQWPTNPHQMARKSAKIALYSFDF